MQQTIRILYVHDSLALWGGIERIFIDKMNFLAAQPGYQVYMLTANQGQHPVPYAMDERISYRDLGVQTHLQYRYRGLRRYWERWRRQRLLRQRLQRQIDVEIQPDIIVATTSRYIPLLLQLRGRRKLIAESHSGFDHVLEYEDMTLRRRLEARRLLRLLRHTDVLVSLTEADADRWRRIHGRVVVIPNMVHLYAGSQYSTQQQRRILFVGRLAQQKGLPELLDVWQLVHRRYPDWQLDIYGEGEHHDWLTCRLAQTPAHGIALHAPTADILTVYRQSALLVSTSRYEPFGLVLVEAMSCGLPVVAFEGDGPSDIITDGADGFLISNRSTADFADRVCRLIADRQLRLDMGRRAVVAVRRYAAERVMPQWQQLFESLINPS